MPPGLRDSPLSASRRAPVLALVLALACACGGSSQAAPTVTGGPPRLVLGRGEARYVIEVMAAGGTGRGVASLVVREAERGELLAALTLAQVEIGLLSGPLDGLEGVVFRWRMSSTGVITAAAGPSAPSRVPASMRARALELWPLLAAAVPHLPDAPVGEGARWDAAQRSQVIGGGRERVVTISGEWRLAKILAGSPATVVLEAELTIVVRDPLLPAEDSEQQAVTTVARAVVYLNLDRQVVDFATVSSDTLSWQARRL